jgi:hypothetical protein
MWHSRQPWAAVSAQHVLDELQPSYTKVRLKPLCSVFEEKDQTGLARFE